MGQTALGRGESRFQLIAFMRADRPENIVRQILSGRPAASPAWFNSIRLPLGLNFHSAERSNGSSSPNSAIESESELTHRSKGVPGNGLILDSTRSCCSLFRLRGVFSLAISRSADAACCRAPARCDSASAACFSALDDAATALSAKVLATVAAVAAEPADCCVSISTLSSKARTLVSASLTQYSAIPSPATPRATNVQPMNPALAIHFRWRSLFPVTSSGHILSQPLRSTFLTWMYQNFRRRATVLRPKPTACKTSGASNTMPIATAIVEQIRIQNHRFDHASKPRRMALSSASVDSGLSGAIGSHQDVDRNEFFLTSLEVLGVVYVISLTEGFAICLVILRVGRCKRRVLIDRGNVPAVTRTCGMIVS